MQLMSRFVIVILVLTSSAMGQAPKLLCTPYDFEPFVIDPKKETGLMFDLARGLNAKGSYNFTVHIFPRGRLLKMLDSGHSCIVPYVAPQWFNDPDRKRYLWTLPLMTDENVILSSRHSPIETLEPREILGKTTATVIGHRDAILDDLIARKVVTTGKNVSLRNSVIMVAKKRLDFIVSGRLILNYLVHAEGLSDSVHFSQKPVQKFERRILLNSRNEIALQAWLDDQIKRLHDDPVWREAIRSTTTPKVQHRGAGP